MFNPSDVIFRQDQLVRNVGIWANNTEYHFWITFFNLIDPEGREHLREGFTREVESANSVRRPFIRWDFWLRDMPNASMAQQYREALRRATSMARNRPYNWDRHTVNTVSDLADNVVEERRAAMRRYGNNDPVHAEILNLWVEAANAFRSNLEGNDNSDPSEPSDTSDTSDDDSC